jgi:hypothetical protein
MSIRVMSWVWENGPQDPTERLVLLAVADFCDDAGRCFPAMASIAAKACLTERGARGVVRRLEADGWLAVSIGGGRGGANRYQINTRKVSAEGGNPEQETRNDKPGMSFPPERGDTKPGTSLHKTRNAGSAEPSLTIKEPSKSNARDAQDTLDALCTVLSHEVAQAFIDHRKAKRAKLTPGAAALIAKKLAGHPNAAAVVEDSIANGWTGIFPDRHAHQPATVTQFPRIRAKFHEGFK